MPSSCPRYACKHTRSIPESHAAVCADFLPHTHCAPRKEVRRPRRAASNRIIATSIQALPRGAGEVAWIGDIRADRCNLSCYHLACETGFQEGRLPLPSPPHHQSLPVYPAACNPGYLGAPLLFIARIKLAACAADAALPPIPSLIGKPEIATSGATGRPGPQWRGGGQRLDARSLPWLARNAAPCYTGGARC